MPKFQFVKIERPGELPQRRLQSDDPSLFIDVVGTTRDGLSQFILVWGDRRILFEAIGSVEGQPPSDRRTVLWTLVDIGYNGDVARANAEIGEGRSSIGGAASEGFASCNNSRLPILDGLMPLRLDGKLGTATNSSTTLEPMLFSELTREG